MDRDKDLKLIWKVIDGEASPAEVITLQHRLRDDDLLRSEYDMALQMNEELSSQPEYEMSDFLQTKILRQLSSLALKRKPIIDIKELRWFGGFQIGVVLCLVAAYFVLGTEPTSTDYATPILNVMDNAVVDLILKASMGIFGLFLLDRLFRKLMSKGLLLKK